LNTLAAEKIAVTGASQATFFADFELAQISNICQTVSLALLFDLLRVKKNTDSDQQELPAEIQLIQTVQF